MSDLGDKIRAQATLIDAEGNAIRDAMAAQQSAVTAQLNSLDQRETELRAIADQVDTALTPVTPPPTGTVIPPVPSGFAVVTAWDFTQATLPSGWKDDGLTFNYATGQMLDCVNLMRNVVYNPTKKCTELWGRKEDYVVPGKTGYWATAHYTACSINVAANWLPGQRVEIFARMNDQHRSCLWSSSGPDEYDFPEHFHSDAPQYNPTQSDHWAAITSYSPVKQYTQVKPALIDGNPHLFWCDYLVDGANVKMGRDATVYNTVPKANLASSTMSHGIHVSEQMGGTWDGGYDAVSKGYWPSIQIPTAASCTDLYMVRLLRKG